MTLAGTLWGEPRQRQSKVILSVATLNGFELNVPPFSFVDKPAEFTQKFAYGKIPAFEATDGFKLTEGSAIARYLATIGTKVDLLGSNPKEIAVIDQWVRFAEHEIATPTGIASAMIYGYGSPFTREALDNFTASVVRAFKHLESHLATRSTAYIASDSLSFADLVVAGSIHQAASLVLGTAERKQYPASFAYYEKVAADERIQQYWSTDGFVDVPITEPTKWTSF